MLPKVQILLIEDDKSICSSIAASLETNNYRVSCAQTGESALSLAASLCPDVILLDLGLPDMDGMEVLEKIRAWSSTPIIVISSRSREQDKVDALDKGADDYLTKPFGNSELMARIRTSLRHSHPNTHSRMYRAGELCIDFDKRRLLLEGKEIHMTQIEFQILTLLAENSGKVLTYSYIMNTVWGPYMDSNNQILRVNMANIRRKIEKVPAQPKYLFTEIGIGYRIRENEA